MFRLSCVPILKATTNYFQSWAKLPFAYINIVTLPVETLFSKLRCLILTFSEIPKPGDWYLKLSNRSEISETEKQHSSWFSSQITERSGYFWYWYSGFDTSRESMPNVSKPLPLRMAERKNGSRTHSADPSRTSAYAPLPHRLSGNTQHENTETQTSALPSGDRPATAPHKWKRNLRGQIPITLVCL